MRGCGFVFERYSQRSGEAAKTGDFDYFTTGQYGEHHPSDGRELLSLRTLGWNVRLAHRLHPVNGFRIPRSESNPLTRCPSVLRGALSETSTVFLSLQVDLLPKNRRVPRYVGRDIAVRF
jgi:hypothetical protein